MAQRVTDLEKFSLEQIWWPYQTVAGLDDVGEDCLSSSPRSLEETAMLLSEDTEWSRLVLDRLRAIGFTFPRYIQHPLVDVVKALTK